MSSLPHVSFAPDHMSPTELPFSCGKKLPHLLLRRKVATKTAELESKPARKQGEILRSIVDHATRSPPCQPCRHRGTASLLPAATRAAVAEFIATSIFVFAAEGSIYSLWKLYTDTETPGGLLAVAIAHALALSAAVAVASDASGGHVNPAVTFGVLVGRRISFGSAALYWAAQLLGAVAAALLLRLVSGGTRPMGFGLGGGPFDGAALNPARAFGPALVGSSWRHHWVCWVGPLIGASLAGALYEFVVIEQQPEAQGATAAAPRMPLAAEDY